MRRKPKAPKAARQNVVPAPTATISVRGNLQVTGEGTWAWFVLGAVPWFFQSTSDRAAVLDAQMMRWSALAGTRVRIRCTSQPVPYSAWARRLDQDTRRDGTDPPTTVTGDTWNRHLVETQKRMQTMRLEDPAVYIGVRFTTDRLTAVQLEHLLDDSLVVEGSLAKTRSALLRISEVMSGEGFAGTPVTSRGFAWLMHASSALGCPVSEHSLPGFGAGWDEHDMDAFTGGVRLAAAPYSKTVQVSALRDGKEHRRHVAVLSMGKMQPRDPERADVAPWLSYSLRMPFPVEWAATFDVVEGEDMKRDAEFYRMRADSIASHFREHAERPPQSLYRGIDDALRIEDEVNEAPREVALRVSGVIRAAVTGSTEDETLAFANELASEFAKNQKIALVHEYGQYDALREFLPGETVDLTGFRRVMPGYFLASAVPNVSTGVGDGYGPYFGFVTSGGRRSVHVDTAWGPEHGGSGLAFVLANLGGGKSVLEGSLADEDVRRGRRVVIFDPSGPLARLADRWGPKFARHVDLSGAEPGTLNPWAQVPEPRLMDHPSQQKWQEAAREADAERRDLAVDSMLMLMPPQLVAGAQGAGVTSAIEAAVNSAGGRYGTNPWAVIRALEADGENAREYATLLRSAARMKGGVLVFPEDESVDVFANGDEPDQLLTVITMPGLSVPPAGEDRAHWTRAERMAVPVLHLAARYATRLIYADHEPKSIYIDEQGIVGSGASSFRSFTLRASRDSRKYDAFVCIAGQNPGDPRTISNEVTNLIGMSWVGRMKDEAAAAAALPFLGVPVGYGYEKVLTRLQPGEWLMRDTYGRVEKVYNDLQHRPDLLAALETTPGRKASA